MLKSAMVVDDSKSARFALRKALESQGYTVTVAESAEECFRMLQRTKPNMIFLDHVMPGIDGFGALRHIRADDVTAHLPIIICSSHDSPEFIREATSIGATAVLQKPPSSDQLTRALKTVEQAATNKIAAAEKAAAESAAKSAAEAKAKLEAEDAASKTQPVAQRVFEAIRNTLSPPSAPPAHAAEPHRDTAISAQLAELRQQTAQLEAKLLQEQEAAERETRLAQEQEAAEREAKLALEREAAAAASQQQNMLDALHKRMDALEKKVEARLNEMQAELNSGLAAQSDHIMRITEAARSTAVENAHEEAQRTVLQAATSITEQITNALITALRSGSFKPLLPSNPAKPNPPETTGRQKG